MDTLSIISWKCTCLDVDCDNLEYNWWRYGFRTLYFKKKKGVKTATL